MTWAKVRERKPDATLRQFGWLCLAAACGFTLVRTGLGRPDVLGGTMVGLAGLMALVGTIRPALLGPLFTATLVVTFPVGFVVSRLLLMLLFWGIVTPIALAFRMAGRDVLRRRRTERATYWEPGRSAGTPSSYFRPW